MRGNKLANGSDAGQWESALPEQLQRLPEELTRVDALLDDPAFS